MGRSTSVAVLSSTKQRPRWLRRRVTLRTLDLKVIWSLWESVSPAWLGRSSCLFSTILLQRENGLPAANVSCVECHRPFVVLPLPGCLPLATIFKVVFQMGVAFFLKLLLMLECSQSTFAHASFGSYELLSCRFESASSGVQK